MQENIPYHHFSRGLCDPIATPRKADPSLEALGRREGSHLRWGPVKTSGIIAKTSEDTTPSDIAEEIHVLERSENAGLPVAV